KLHRIRKNKKKLGRSIEERPKEINKRNEFGHWECDLVLGHKSKDDEVLLTLSERMSREFLILRIPDKTSVSVMQAFKELQRQYSEHWNDIFKTNTSCDKGTVERHNGLIRRFIPKGEAIANYSLQDIINIETWCNSLPRKILAYHTPDEIFERELDLIYQAA
ncbi:IS30 family transposase, partial [Lactobacillus helveticus]